MFPVEFAYERPATVAEAIMLLTQSGGEAKVLAGGHSLLPLMKLRLVQPPMLVDISRIDALRGITLADGRLHIGALTTETEIQDAPLIQQHAPLLAETAGKIGDQQVRNRGTIGGSLAHGDPAADMTAALLALDGRVRVEGPGGSRLIQANDLFVDMLTTSLEPDEILTAVEVPVQAPHTGSAYEKFANAASGYALVGVAAVVSLDSQGACSAVRVAITGASNRATRAAGVEAALQGQRLDDTMIGSAAEHAAEGLHLISDLHADEGYRAHLARVCTRRALQRAAARAATAS
jgi:carbon-monoxide dehydrogenase medium subunit